MRHMRVDISGTRRAVRDLKDKSKKALPWVCRNTLNDITGEMKGNRSRPGTMERTARKKFRYARSPAFFRATTGRTYAKGNDIDKMETMAGVYKKNSNYSRIAEGLSRQHEGKAIDHAFAPLPKSRISRSPTRRVSKPNRHSELGSYEDLTNMRGQKRQLQLLEAHSKRQQVLISGKKGKIWVASPMRRTTRDPKTRSERVKLKFLYQKNRGKKAVLSRRTPYVYIAAKESLRHAPQFFVNNFNKKMKGSR